MPSNLRQYKVFLGLTKNLEKEREKFHEVLREFSQEKEEQGLSFKPVDYLQIPGDCGRPQEIINKEINRSDYAVFVLYDNLGSDAGGEAKKTGIEEEWDLVKDLRQKGKIIRVALFFKKVDPDKEKDPGDRLKELLSFKRKVIDKKEALFDEYSTLEDFERKLRTHLIRWASTQNNKDENSSPFLLSGGFPSSKECEPDNGQEPPSFHYWMQEVNQLLECGIKKQNSVPYLSPEEYINALFCANKALEAAKSKVETVQALNSVGRTKFYLRDYQGAIECCDEIIKKFGGESELSLKEPVARALYNKGVVLSQVGQWEESVKSYDEVIGKFGGESELSLKEQVARALYNKGVALCQLKHEVEAIGVYDEVNRKFGGESELSLKEQVARALYNKGITLCQLGYWKESSGVFEEVIRRFESVASSNIQEIVINARKQPKFTSDW